MQRDQRMEAWGWIKEVDISILKQMEILPTIVSYTHLFKACSISNTCTYERQPSTDVCVFALLHFSCAPAGRTNTTNLSLQSAEELSLGPLVGGVSKLPSNHIQCRDWRGARPHLELIAADATQHKEMGCRGVDGVGWGYFSSQN